MIVCKIKSNSNQITTWGWLTWANRFSFWFHRLERHIFPTKAGGVVEREVVHHSGTEETPPEQEVLSSLLQRPTALFAGLSRDQDRKGKSLGSTTTREQEHSRNQHVQTGEQLSPWWPYAPRQSPTTRWRTPLWRSFWAAPSAPGKQWWSRLEGRRKKRNLLVWKSVEKQTGCDLSVKQSFYTRSRRLGPDLQKCSHWGEVGSWCCRGPRHRCPTPCWSLQPGQTVLDARSTIMSGPERTRGAARETRRVKKSRLFILVLFHSG